MTDSSPLNALCGQDPAGYRANFDQLSKRLGADAMTELWNAPLVAPIGLLRILERWIALDVLERRPDAAPDRLHVLRAEALAHYAVLDGSGAAADRARWHLDRLDPGAAASLAARIGAIRTVLTGSASRPMEPNPEPGPPLGVCADGTIVLITDSEVQTLAVNPEPCTCALSLAGAVWLGYADGTLVRLDLGTEPRETARARDDDLGWETLASVVHDGRPALATVDVLGDVCVRDPDTLAILESFALEGLRPNAAAGCGEHLWIADDRGRLRRYRVASPTRHDAFLAEPTRVPFTALRRADDGGLVVLTATGVALRYDGDDPAALPTAFAPPGETLACAGQYDSTRVLVASTSGRLWLLAAREGTEVEFGACGEASPLAITRRRDRVISLHASGAARELALPGNAEDPKPGPSRPIVAPTGALIAAWS